MAAPLPGGCLLASLTIPSKACRSRSLIVTGAFITPPFPLFHFTPRLTPKRGGRSCGGCRTSVGGVMASMLV